ncbi:dynein regulatory complex subunit 4-like [Neolamprologus brichardi]|uniref:dynein regulatory complex subunit 4-like n=1 Tax=Neolamprologus brichardi TaxID=32507 RepID=UPI0003EBD706|nr:dynein regulatory complex subunit 4-like [Neolamprologus brichardi]
MPPKAKSKKKGGNVKSSTVMDGLSTEDMSKDQLEEHIIHLREELDREQEEKSYFQLERDKIQAFWEISKRNLDKTKAELRNRSRERDEAEERHRVEIEVFWTVTGIHATLNFNEIPSTGTGPMAPQHDGTATKWYCG